MNRRKHQESEFSNEEINKDLKKAKKSDETTKSDKNPLTMPQFTQKRLDSFFLLKKDLNLEQRDPIEKDQIIKNSQKQTEIIIESDSDISYYSDEENKGSEQKQTNPQKSLREMPNLMFYMNMVPSRPNGDLVENIHRYWRFDYKKLEFHHGYIQWLFPNYFSSSFNNDAFKLSHEEAKIFRINKEVCSYKLSNLLLQVALRLISSYELILGFFGIILADKKTGRLERAKNFEERYNMRHYLTKRYYSTLITSLHNHLRVRRILAHLNVVGFRKYAIQLVKFLETEIFGEVGGYRKFLSNTQLDPEYIKELRKNPLYSLIKHNIYKDWKLLGEVSTKEEKEKLFGVCLVNSESELQDSVYFTS